MVIELIPSKDYSIADSILSTLKIPRTGSSSFLLISHAMRPESLFRREKKTLAIVATQEEIVASGK